MATAHSRTLVISFALPQVLNAFMCTGFTRDTNQYFTKPSPVRKGDYIEFLGEHDTPAAAAVNDSTGWWTHSIREMRRGGTSVLPV